MTRTVVFGTVVALLALQQADAAVVCQQKKSGHLLLRPTACKRAETLVDLPALAMPSGGITPANLSPGARTASGSVTLEGTTSATTPTALSSFTVQVPGPGTVLVTVAGMLMINADATTQAALTVPARIGLCDTPATDTQCAGTYTQVWYQDADDADAANATPAFTLTRTVAVAAAGPRVFYVNGEAPATPGASLSLWVDPIVGAGPVASATFVPAALTVTTP